MIGPNNITPLFGVGAGALKQTYLYDVNFLYRTLRHRRKNMKEYGWNNFKDFIFRNPAVVDQVRFPTCFSRFSLES